MVGTSAGEGGSKDFSTSLRKDIFLALPGCFEAVGEGSA